MFIQGQVIRGAETEMGSVTIGVRNPQATQAAWNQVSYFIKTKADYLIESVKDGAGHRLQPDVLYALFANAVEFDTPFKGIQEGYIAKDFQEAAARVVLQEHPVGSSFTFSPYWSEALAHLAGFMVQGNPAKSSRTTFIVMGFDSVGQTTDFEASKEYLVYTRINRWEENTAFCDAYIFDGASSRLIMQCHDLRYMELPRAAWRHILDGGDVGRRKASTTAPKTIKAAPKEAPKVDVVLPVDNKQTTQAPQQAEAPASDGLFDVILSVIAKATGVDPSEFTDDTQIADLGVDSIMAIEVVSSVKAKSGVDLPAMLAFEYPSVGDLRREFGSQQKPLKVLEPRSSSTSNATLISGYESSAFAVIDTPESVSSNEQDFVKIENPSETFVDEVENEDIQEIEDESPLPSVRITLLKGRRNSDKTPLYLMADGTGSIATYIHLPPSKAGHPIFGVDSPFCDVLLD